MHANEESYVLMPNLRSYLASAAVLERHEAGEALYLGRQLNLGPDLSGKIFNSLGAVCDM